MGFLDSLKDSFANSGNIEEASSLGGDLGSMFGNSIGNFLGDAVDAVKKVAGEIVPQFASKADAEDSLFNDAPTWLDPKDATSIGLDEKTDNAYPSMTHIRNFVRAEFLRREHNVGIAYPNSGEYAGEMNTFSRKDNSFVQGLGNRDSNASSYTNDISAFDYPAGPNGSLKREMFLSDNYVGQTYKGPKAAWVRVMSNTIVQLKGKNEPFEGFVLHGVDNFDDMYGFVKPDSGAPGDCVLGYDVHKRPHFMQERDFKHRPPPGITGIDSEEMGVGKNQKKTTVKFTAWSRSQVDYLDPYFFTPGNTVLVEWGWNTFDRDSLIDLTNVGRAPDAGEGGSLSHKQKTQVNANRAKDPDYALEPIPMNKFGEKTMYEMDEGTGLVALWNSAQAARRKIRNGKGNYSFTLGMVSNYSYALRDDGGYDCTVEIMSMAFFATQLQLPASSQKPGGSTDPDDDRELNIREFIENYLHEMVVEGDADPDELFGDMSDSAQSVWNSGGADSSKNSLMAKGRYFSFGLTDEGNLGTDDNKQYMAGSPADGSYITIGYLVDIFSAFFGRKSKTTDADITKFKVEGKRCVAHPNIKSTDGGVLLIPNSMAPRHNLKNFNSTTIGLAGEGDKDGINDSNPINHSVAFDQLAKAGNDDPNTAAFIAVVAAQTGRNITTLQDAMKASPRDDIHRLITLKPEMNDGIGVSKTADDVIHPFPDYKIIDEHGRNEMHTKGYSGRIQDLMVNYDIVKDAVLNGQTATGMLKTILKKVSNAAGGIWDFDLVGDDPSNPSNTVLTIVDRRMSTNTVDEEQRLNKAYVFKSHQKNSIVRSMSCDVSIPGDVAAMVLYGKNSENPNSNFFARKPEDRILKEAGPVTKDGKKVAEKKIGLAQGSDDIPSEEKYLVGIKVYHGATGIAEEFRKAKEGDDYERDDGSDAATGAMKIDSKVDAKRKVGGPGVNVGALNLDNVGSADGVGGTKSGGSTDGWGTSEDGKVIDIEFVDPNRDRMMALMRKDKDPKNCVKYNMALDGIELSLQLDGIEGIRLWDMFNCTGVPTKYFMTGLWRVTSVKHSISGNDWVTDVSAQFAPNSADSFDGS